jgi:hypothetical protein
VHHIVIVLSMGGALGDVGKLASAGAVYQHEKSGQSTPHCHPCIPPPMRSRGRGGRLLLGRAEPAAVELGGRS